MSPTATKPARAATRRPRPAAAKKPSNGSATAKLEKATKPGGTGKAAKKATKPGAASKIAKKAVKPGTVGKVAKEAVKPGSGSGVSGLARAAAKKALKLLARKAVQSGARTLRAAADRTADAGKGALEASLQRRLPVQVSIDVAVPPIVAWDEWMTLESLTEGVNRIEEIEREGDVLVGTIAGPRSSDWVAEILDERQGESFAWRSVEGSDVAGLVTFHRLSDRLTRIELDLDVVPTRPAEAIRLSLHVANRRAEAELRRFKARVEFISPDVYEQDVERNGAAPDSNNDL